MLTQLKLAIRILRRRKFFTFISLFGISFTIMALVFVAALGDASLGDSSPLGNRDRLVLATHMRSEYVSIDTSYLIDSAVVNGTMVFDSTLQENENTEQDNNSMLSYLLYDQYLRDQVDGAEMMSFIMPNFTFNTYKEGRKIQFRTQHTDAKYWQVFNYEFIAGGPFNNEHVDGGALVAAISDEAAIDYFGYADERLLGQQLQLADRTFTLIGVFRNPRTAMLGESAVVVPYTVNQVALKGTGYHGPGMVAFLAETPAGRDRIKESLATIAGNLNPTVDDDEKNRFHVEGLTYAEQLATRYYGGEGINRASAFWKFFGPLLVLLAMFILLPALNLTNVNISRVYERAPEIAVRKSFGATDGDIMRQFLIETLVVTFIGGLIGVLLSLGLIAAANTGEWISGITLKFTPEVVLYTLVLLLVFGLLTGLLPAYRMAQTRIATALR